MSDEKLVARVAQLEADLRLVAAVLAGVCAWPTALTSEDVIAKLRTIGAG